MVIERRTKLDCARIIRAPADVHHPETERIVLVLDNLP